MEVDIKDLKYELRMLIGADRMVQLFEEKDIGNPINYFKDSVYLHARNLYSFFYKNSRKEITNNYNFDMTEYSSNWMIPLNNYVMHIDDDNKRNIGNNELNGLHINQKVHWFTSDIIRLWQEWIDSVVDLKFKEDLENALSTAYKEAADDYDGMVSNLK